MSDDYGFPLVREVLDRSGLALSTETTGRLHNSSET